MRHMMPDRAAGVRGELEPPVLRVTGLRWYAAPGLRTMEASPTPEGRSVQIPKPTETDKEFFRSVVPDDPRVDVKPMFGNLGAFVNGNMFAGLFGASVG